MQSELYTAAQGLIGRQIQLDNITHNIANANTTGFREVSSFFRSFNQALVDGPENPLNNAANNQPVVAGIFYHSRQGPIKTTNNPLDMAIEGDGFFKVQTPNGVRFTRNGNFGMDNQGQLITSNGYPVLNSNNQPMILNRAEEIYTKQDGTLLQDGNVVGKLNLVTFADKEQMTPEEDTLLVHRNPNAVEQVGTGRILGGHLENSNINLAKQMVDMISMQRAYDANIRVVKTVDTNFNEMAIRGLGPR